VELGEVLDLEGLADLAVYTNDDWNTTDLIRRHLEDLVAGKVPFDRLVDLVLELVTQIGRHSIELALGDGALDLEHEVAIADGVEPGDRLEGVLARVADALLPLVDLLRKVLLVQIADHTLELLPVLIAAPNVAALVAIDALVGRSVQRLGEHLLERLEDAGVARDPDQNVRVAAILLDGADAVH